MSVLGSVLRRSASTTSLAGRPRRNVIATSMTSTRARRRYIAASSSPALTPRSVRATANNTWRRHTVGSTSGQRTMARAEPHRQWFACQKARCHRHRRRLCSHPTHQLRRRRPATITLSRHTALLVVALWRRQLDQAAISARHSLPTSLQSGTHTSIWTSISAPWPRRPPRFRLRQP